MELSPFERIFGELPGTKKSRTRATDEQIRLRRGELEAADEIARKEKTTAERDAIDRMALKVLDESPDSGMSYDAARIEAGKRVRDMQFNRGLADATTARNDQLFAEGAQPRQHTLGGATTDANIAAEKLKEANAMEGIESGVPLKRSENIYNRMKNVANTVSEIPAINAENNARQRSALLQGEIAGARMASAPQAAAARDTLDLDTALNLTEKARAERPKIRDVTTATQEADLAKMAAEKALSQGQMGNQELANDAEAAALREKFAASNYGAQNPQFIRRYNPLANVPNLQQALMLGGLLEGVGGQNGVPTTATPAPTTPDSKNATPLRFKSTGQNLR